MPTMQARKDSHASENKAFFSPPRTPISPKVSRAEGWRRFGQPRRLGAARQGGEPSQRADGEIDEAKPSPLAVELAVPVLQQRWSQPGFPTWLPSEMSSDKQRDLRCAFTELLRGVDVCLILDPFGELITCPIQEGRRSTSPLGFYFAIVTSFLQMRCDMASNFFHSF